MPSIEMSFEEKVNRLHDRVNILETIYSYCNYTDQLNAKGVVSLFTDDCILSYRKSNEKLIKGRSKLLGFLEPIYKEVVSQSHYITNVRLYFETEDSVVAHMYMHSRQRFKNYPDKEDVIFWGRYEKRLVRVDKDEWRISNLRLRIASSSGTSGQERLAEHVEQVWPPRFESLETLK